MTKLKNIELITENCDFVKIPQECISFMQTSDITEKIIYFKDGKELKTKVIGNLILVLNSKAKHLKFDFLQSDKRTLFEVIKNQYNNLCAIKITSESDDKLQEPQTVCYDLKWPEKEEYTNTYQKVEEIGDELIIGISKNNTLYEIMAKTKDMQKRKIK